MAEEGISEIYQLKITLKGSKPSIWRRIQTNSRITFYQLHEILQIAFDWTDTHLHEFECRVPPSKLDEIYEIFQLRGFSRFLTMGREPTVHMGDPEQDDGFLTSAFFLSEREQILAEWLVEIQDKCLYTYDFGDDWQHEIVLEKILEAQSETHYPFCVRAVKEAPLEDSGGVWLRSVEEDDVEKENARSDKEITTDINEEFQYLIQKWNDHDSYIEMATLGEWDYLFKWAIRFKDLKSWQWMDDAHLFAVQDEKNGQTGYCCVMGGGGEIFGLAVYVGAEGVDCLLKTLQGKIDEQDYFNQQSLMLSFEDRKDIEQQDYELIKSLGLSFRGRNQWPVFRSFQPGLYPWFLNRQEVLFLTRVLEQACEICIRAKDLPEKYEMKNNEVFTRRYMSQGEKWVWEDTRMLLELKYEAAPVPALVDELDLLRRRKNLKLIPLVVEFDFMYYPVPVQDHKGQRPYYPYHALWVDHEQEFILGATVVPRGDHAAAFQEKTLEIIEQMEAIPEEIWVQREPAFEILASITQKLGVRLKLVQRLTIVNSILDEMKGQF